MPSFNNNANKKNSAIPFDIDHNMVHNDVPITTD